MLDRCMEFIFLLTNDTKVIERSFVVILAILKAMSDYKASSSKGFSYAKPERYNKIRRFERKTFVLQRVT